MFRFHITFGIEKKILATVNKIDIHNAARQLFSVQSEPTLLQTWDVEFEDWVDVEDTRLLPDKCKLQLTIRGRIKDLLFSRVPTAYVSSLQ